MTPQEQQLLTSLTQRINQTQLQEKDQDAENLLGREIGANPDAMYILAQTVLVQNIALEQARAQVNQLQQQAQQSRPQPAHATSFLGRLLGDHDPAPQSQPAPPPYQPVPSQPQYAQPQYAPPQYQQPQFVSGGQPSFMRGAMQTAAGVAAGALAFEGVESILHGFGHGGYGSGMGMAGFGMGPGMGMGGGFERPVEENVVNNYYDSPGGQGGAEPHFHESSEVSGAGIGGDDFSGSGAQLKDASYNTSGNDAGNDQVGYDDSRLDDASSSYDNSVDNVQIDDSGQDDGSQDAGGDVGFDDGGGGDDGSSVL